MKDSRALSSSPLSSSCCALPPGVVQYHHVMLEGRARTFVNRLAAEAVCDLGDNSHMRVYMYCWIDSERGQGAHVHYAPRDIALQPGSGTGLQDAQHDGEFSMGLHVLDNDPDLLKIMACMRMRDQETKNERTVTLAASAVQMDRLLMGEEQTLTMYSQFDPGNYTEVVIRASNANEFANCPHATPSVSGQPLPLVKLSRSNLWDMGISDQVASEVSGNMQEKIQKYLMESPPGGQPFIPGLTRSAPVSQNDPLLFFSLFLGTPGYALTPLLAPQLGIQRGSIPVWSPSDPHDADPLHSHEHPRGVTQAASPNPARGVPYLPPCPPFGLDSRGCPQTRRCGFWAFIRSGFANNM